MLRSRLSADPERGSASLEFLAGALILLVPIVYLVLTVGIVQGGALAVEGAARQAARVYVQAATPAEARASAERAVAYALDDFGMSSENVSVDISCSDAANGCLVRRNSVTVSVRVSVPLPLVPDVLSLPQRLAVPLEARATQQVSRFWGARS